jgi:hypothetical protein
LMILYNSITITAVASRFPTLARLIRKQTQYEVQRVPVDHFPGARGMTEMIPTAHDIFPQ